MKFSTTEGRGLAPTIDRGSTAYLGLTRTKKKKIKNF